MRKAPALARITEGPPQCKADKIVNERHIRPPRQLNELIVTENDFMKLVIHGSSFLYLCEKDNTCGLDIVLISDARTFDDNDLAYRRLLESLSANGP